MLGVLVYAGLLGPLLDLIVPIFVLATAIVVLLIASYLPLKGNLTSEMIGDVRFQEAMGKRLDEIYGKGVHLPDVTSEEEAESNLDRTARLRGNVIIYLRPFEVDLSFRVLGSRRAALAALLVPFYRSIFSKHFSLDDAIRANLSDYGKLVVIGGAPGDSDDELRLQFSDASWKAYFRPLTEGARAIIMHPGARPGTIWEIEEISNDNLLLEKTIFVFPPARKSILGMLSQRSRKRSASDREQFEKTRNALISRGLRGAKDIIPGEAVIFCLDRSIELRTRVFVNWLPDTPMITWKLRELMGRAIERSRSHQIEQSAVVLESLPPSGDLDESVVAFLKRTERARLGKS